MQPPLIRALGSLPVTESKTVRDIFVKTANESFYGVLRISGESSIFFVLDFLYRSQTIRSFSYSFILCRVSSIRDFLPLYLSSNGSGFSGDGDGFFIKRVQKRINDRETPRFRCSYLDHLMIHKLKMLRIGRYC